ncbi:GNAT family N-acetyltransferase, partial [candidate division WOR-3 bacterium]|nr:GNAT family N-acetyltransferase [candidate division WOR-3 bacterium]
SWCNKGIGTLIIRKVSNWCFKLGLKALRLDVAAANTRAIRCYEKAGFVKTEEFWRNDKGLRNIDVNQPQYDFLRPHVRLDRDVPQIRFWWMDLVDGCDG